jgi:hypothetical protein
MKTRIVNVCPLDSSIPHNETFGPQVHFSPAISHDAGLLSADLSQRCRFAADSGVPNYTRMGSAGGE